MQRSYREEKKKLIILTGPTAVGKTALSIGLAKQIQGEIVSADSIQVYRHLDIGSAKITREEMQGIPHHLIDILDPTEAFHVMEFKKRALEAMEGIYGRGHIPILTGGTGFYIQALLYDIQFSDEMDDGYRDILTGIRKEKGEAYLHTMLREVDPVSADKIHQNNTKRVIRALEFYHQTGRPISEHNKEEQNRVSPYNFAYFVLNRNREELYKRIELRIDQMLKDGLVEEVKNIKASFPVTKDMTSMQGLGYKEILAYLNGECSLEEAIYILKRDTRHFAKRQLTWFKREREVIWLDRDIYQTEQALMDVVMKHLNEKKII